MRHMLSDEELCQIPVGSPFVFDIECYPNFFFIAFKSVINGGIVTFEQSPSESINLDKLNWMLWRFLFVGFNSNTYDLPMLTMALDGRTVEELKEASFKIILKSLRQFQSENMFRIKIPNINHIDLIEVCPLMASLKTYGGRLHCDEMQDLPYAPDTHLTYDEAQEVKKYCYKDLDKTELIFSNLKSQIELREQLSKEYNQDLRSKSDAQIAEAVITKEVGKINGHYSKKPIIKEGFTFEYKIPEFINYHTPDLSNMLEIVRKAQFYIGKDGGPKAPKEIEGLIVKVGNTQYRMGTGGLHSNEKTVSHIAKDGYLLIDRDVESYYPRIIINQRLFPKHMGEAFLKVYEEIVARRIEAKRAKNSIIADSLKITINGSFGKLGSKFSALYAPDLMLQVTLSGQLCLLMLIEMIESVGISVVSGNTDGIVIKCPQTRYDELNAVIEQWESITNFKTEETRYKAVYSKDVNNYIAVKEDGKCKTKGVYSNPWIDAKSAIFRFHKNPQTTICSEAIVKLITNGTSIADSIVKSRDITKFISVRKVEGGAEKINTIRIPDHKTKEELIKLAGFYEWYGGTFRHNRYYEELSVFNLEEAYRLAKLLTVIKEDKVYLGEVIRWYYSVNEKRYINYKKNGNKVPKSDGAKPLMDLPKEFPSDIDYNWYINEAKGMLYDIGYYSKAKLF